MILPLYIIESPYSIDQRRIYGLGGEEVVQEKLCRATCPWELAGGTAVEGVWGEEHKIGNKRGKQRDNLHSFPSRGRVAKSKNRGDPVKFKFLV